MSSTSYELREVEKGPVHDVNDVKELDGNQWHDGASSVDTITALVLEGTHLLALTSVCLAHSVVPRPEA